MPGNGQYSIDTDMLQRKLLDGVEPHPSNYRGCRHAREGMRKRKLQRAPKSTPGRLLSSNCTTPALSLAAALRSNIRQEHQPQPPSFAQACTATVGEMSAPPPLRHNPTAAALRSNTRQEQQPQPPSFAQACTATEGEMSGPAALEAQPTPSSKSVSSDS
jgi:hypothetical protein